MSTRHASHAAVLAATLAAVLLTPAPASACGGMVFPDHAARVGGMSDQELAVVFGASETVLVASAGYQGIDAAEFAFLMPLASAPSEVRDADPALFFALDEFSAPRVTIHTDSEQPTGLCSGGVRAGDAGNALGGDTGGDVMIHDRGETATYEYVVIGGDTGTAVADWLTGAGYPLPADYAAALDPYIADDWFFFAARVKSTAPGGALAPIELHLPPSRPETFQIPLAIAAHSITPGDPLALTTYFLAGGPVLTSNYPTQAVDRDLLVASSDTETNYAELERAVLDSDPAGAWILDYSGAQVFIDDLELAHEEGELAGRIDPSATNRAFLTDFAARLDLEGFHLTRLRTELQQGQLRDLDLRAASGPPADNYYYVTFDPDEGDSACAIDRSGRLPQLLLLVPVLAWIRRRPRRA